MQADRHSCHPLDRVRRIASTDQHVVCPGQDAARTSGVSSGARDERERLRARGDRAQDLAGQRVRQCGAGGLGRTPQRRSAVTAPRTAAEAPARPLILFLPASATFTARQQRATSVASARDSASRDAASPRIEAAGG
jgi:hypothetical protein